MKNPHSKGVLAALLASASLTVMSGATIAASLPHIQEIFADEENAALLTRLVLTLPALFIAVGAPLAGLFVDRYGRLKPLLFGLLLYALAGTSGLYATTLEGILIGRALLGSAVAMIMTVTTTLAGDYFSGEARNRYIGLQGMAMASGGVIFILLGGLLADIHWRVPFAVYFASLAIFPVALYFLKEPKKITHDQDGNDHIRQSLLPVYVIGFLGMVAMYMVPVQLPFLLHSRFELGGTLIGTVIASATLTAAVASSLYRRIRRRLSIRGVYTLLLVFYGTGFVGIGFSPSYGVLQFFAVLSGFGMGWFMVNSHTWMLERAHPSIRGRASGFMATAIFLGQFASPIVMQPVIDAVGVQKSFTVVGVVMFVWLGYLLLSRRISKRR